MAPAIGLLGANVSEFQAEVKSKCLRRLGLNAVSIEEKLVARKEASYKQGLGYFGPDS